MSLKTPGWQFWIDRGGTFTDIVALRPDDTLLARKLLSENPERYPDAALHGMREILGLTPEQRLSDAPVDTVRMGTTVGTNALLERKGEPTLLAITAGFGDALRIGRQNRPDIFALAIRRPEPLYSRVIEIEGRLDASGQEWHPLDPQSAADALTSAYREGFRSVAVVLIHAWRNPAHELAIGELAKRIGFTQISLSHQASPALRLISRGDTTVADAYLSPVLRRYVNGFLAGFGTGSAQETATRLAFMQSNGGLVDAHAFQGKDSVLSGPAGGLVGAVESARRAGFDKLVTFDMGGTSTDVAHYAGELERNPETELSGIRLRVPMLNIHTVAAGGGSILHYDGIRFRVGPDSAGANPGPAGYRRGGPLTVTDANVMVGKLRAAHFPKVFGPEGNLTLDETAVEEGFRQLAGEIGRQSGRTMTPEAVAEGFIDVAVENMAAAIKRITVRRGFDLADYTLCCFGAAGGQHACRVAERLGIPRILLHPLAGVLSAYGMGWADYRVLKELAVVAPLNDSPAAHWRSILDALEAEGLRDLEAQGIAADRIEVRRQLQLRYRGADTLFNLDFEPAVDLTDRFESAHRRRFGFVYESKDLLVEAALVELSGRELTPEEMVPAAGSSKAIAPLEVHPVFTANAFRETPFYQRETLVPGTILEGPAVLIEATATTVIETGWRAEITTLGHLLLTRTATGERENLERSADPVRLEVFNRLFTSVAEDMGQVLQDTAHSVNIRERLDFSCALFDGYGELVANAPHIPVHLGSMGECVKALVRNFGQELKPGDAWLSNSPYHGGTHLPDITVVTPVFDADGRSLLFLLASRGHHADVGGITPGSMPPYSRDIGEEGVLSGGLRIVEDGRFKEEDVRAWLDSGPYPARNPEQNLADLHAQIAANEKGRQSLERLVQRYSLDVVTAYMSHVQDHGEEAVRRVIAGLEGGQFRVELDSGAVIRVAIRIDREARRAVVDFSGTSPQQPDNLNAPAAVCRAAVLYVFRTLVREEIPLNAGCLRPIEIIVPEGSLLNPKPPAAVAAGNVETSQHVVDALYGALGVMAAAQGSMNNFTFGNERFQYYETICGGAGAGADFDGADAVHTHMTNSRITDPEVLEWRYPVLVERFGLRAGSGGAGRQRGGQGAIRRIRFLEPMTAGILSTRRIHPPFGLKGGQPGAAGRNTVIRRDGTMEPLDFRAEVAVEAGDAFLIETPGGGGFGEDSN